MVLNPFHHVLLNVQSMHQHTYSLGTMCYRWDNACCEGQDWQKAAGVADLQKGCEQTFYHLLVDAKDWEASWERPPVAYVAEELLDAPEVR